MYVVFRKDTLGIDQLVYTAGPEFMEWLTNHQDLGIVETSMDKQANEIGIELVDGEPSLFTKQGFPFGVPTIVQVGVEIRITGVPNKTVLTTELGSNTIPSSGILDLTFDTAGTYTLAFTHPRFLTYNVTVEAVTDLVITGP